MTRRLAQQAVIIMCAAILLLAPLATALASQSGSYHWARKVPQFTLRFGNNVSSNWTGIFQASLSEWNRNDTITLREAAGSTNPQSCSPASGTVQVCSAAYGTGNGWLGLTRLYFNTRGDHIESVTVQMNDSFLFASGSQYNSDAPRRHTMCHELGHSLGLDHSDSGSCMNDSQQAVFDNVKPTNQDFAQLARIYQHTDSSSTVAGKQKQKKKKKGKKGKKGKGGKRHKGNDKNRRNRQSTQSEGFFAPTTLPPVQTSADGTETVTTQTLANGQQVVTFITWAK